MDARAVGAALCVLALTGCGTFAPGATPIRVPVPVLCRQSVPPRPAMPTDSLVPPVRIDPWIAAAQSELDVREAYETDLRARLVACTAG